MKSLGLAVVATATMALGGHAAAYDCSAETYAVARPLIESIFKQGFMQPMPGEALAVLVADDLWSSFDFPTKAKFADSFVCSVAGQGYGLSSMTFKSLQTGKVLAEWSQGTLRVK